MQVSSCAYCGGASDLTWQSCSHGICRICSVKNRNYQIPCPECQAMMNDTGQIRASGIPCTFEKQGPGKCTHGINCPRSHDPALLSQYWPALAQPSIPIVLQQTDPGPKSSVQKYVFNEHFLEDENKRTEFKACAPQNFEVQLAVHMLAKYICAFLNTQGGVLYYGITDDHIVKGLMLNAQQRDKLRLAIDQCCNSFSPEVDTDKVTVKFEKVYLQGGGERKDAFVVVIRVLKGDPGQVYFTPDYKAWCRREASIRELKASALVAFIKKKLQGQEDEAEEELKVSPKAAVQQSSMVWEFLSSDRGLWTPYPEEVQSQLEAEFQSHVSNTVLYFRGEQSFMDFMWMRESKGFAFYEVRRVDFRNLGHGTWWTHVNEQFHFFDQKTNETLDQEFLNEKPDAEVYIDDFMYYVSFERMRLTGDMPIWRKGE